MSKQGGTKHVKRIAAAKAIPITDKKARTWMLRPFPGPHPRKASMPIGVLLRDILKIAETAKEIKKALSAKLVLVDGKARSEEKFPCGMMDVISFPKADKYYRLVVDWKGRIVPIEITKESASSKILKVVGKHTMTGGKLSATFHDGRNAVVDNHIKVGDSVVVSLPDAKVKTHLKMHPGARCLVREGKHAGHIVKLKEMIMRRGGKPNEALVTGDDGEFITVAKYLFVVDDNFKVKAG